MIEALGLLCGYFLPESYKHLLAAILSGQGLCAGWIAPGEFRDLNLALICGINLPPGSAKQSFADTGLIHLMVVSGSHLVFWEKLLFFLPVRARLAALGVYCYLTGFQPPVVLAFVRRAAGPWCATRLGWTPTQRELMNVIVILAAIPGWILSRSFLMSWACGLALVSPAWLKDREYLDPSLKIYFFLLPFSFSEPVTIFWNAILSPLVGGVLFPICLSSLLIPAAGAFADQMWRVFLILLASGPQASPSVSFVQTIWLLPWPVALHGILIAREIRWRRALAFSVS